MKVSEGRRIDISGPQNSAEMEQRVRENSRQSRKTISWEIYGDSDPFSLVQISS